MKKLFIIVVLISGNFMVGFSQRDSNFVIAKNINITKYTKEGAKITVSDVYSKQSKLERKVEILNANNVSIGTAYIKLESLNAKENMYDKINKTPNNFSGTVSIEIDNQIVYSRKIINGVVLTTNGGRGPGYNPNLSCTIRTVHNCVAYNIDSMNWVQYAICLFTAPGCYIEQWLSCYWEVCHNHMQY